MYATIAAIVAMVHTVYSLGVRRIHDQAEASSSGDWVNRMKRFSGVVSVGLGMKLLRLSAFSPPSTQRPQQNVKASPGTPVVNARM